MQEVGYASGPNKEEGPSEVITFLGLEIDSINMEVRLPPVNWAS